jgi:quercetin dioxygenase-like cupin family protein
MREVRLEAVRGLRPVDRYGSSGFEAAGLPPSAHVAVAALAAGGRIGVHPAPVDQLLMVVQGRATVTARGEALEIGPGQAVLWETGEEHSTDASEDVVALIIEAENLSDWLG